MDTEIQIGGKELLKKGMSVLHESLADYMLINPGCTLREMGAYFGYSGAWLCTVMSTDMFKAYMAARRSEVEAVVAQDLPSKLRAAAHLATEKMIEILDHTEDPKIVADCFDKILHRHGYAPNAKVLQGPVQNIQQDHAEAKQLLQNAHIALPAPMLMEVGAESG